MFGIVKGMTKTAVLATASLAAVVGGSLLIAGPGRTMAMAHEIQHKVSSAIDSNLDDPIALKRQLDGVEGGRLRDAEQRLPPAGDRGIREPRLAVPDPVEEETGVRGRRRREGVAAVSAKGWFTTIGGNRRATPGLDFGYPAVMVQVPVANQDQSDVRCPDPGLLGSSYDTHCAARRPGID